MINLREASGTTTQATEFRSSVSFARFGISSGRLGNIGEPLRFGNDDEEEDMEDQDEDGQARTSPSSDTYEFRNSDNNFSTDRYPVSHGLDSDPHGV